MPELKRTLSLAEVVFFASGVILGAGIYTVIGKAAGLGGNMLWLSFFIASLAALLTIFAYAELSAMYPMAGGEFFYVKEAMGRRPSFFIGVLVAAGGIVAAATIAIGFAGYLSEILEMSQVITGIGITLLILLVNILGIRHSSTFNIVFTLIETAGLVFVIISAIPSAGNHSYTEPPPTGAVGIFSAAALCFFAFTGFEDVVKLAEETKKPTTTIPKALFISAFIIMLLYTCISLLAVSAVPFEELSRSEKPLSLVVETRFGQKGALVLSIVALFSTSNSLLSNMLGASRVMYHMGRESKRLSVLSRVLKKRQTPVVALLLAAACIAGFVLIGDIKRVALIANFFIFAVFLTTNITVIYLRIKRPGKDRPFRIPLNVRNIPIPSLLAIALVLVLIVFAVLNLVSGEGGV